MMTRGWSTVFVLALSVARADAVLAQAVRQPTPPEEKPPGIHRPSPERMAADGALSDHLMRALSVTGVGIGRRDTLVELQLENWKRGLEIDTIAAVARRGLALILREDSSARRAKTLSARFSDYTPHVVTLTWAAKDFTAHPERFHVTRGK